ncbi:MAG: hypothetical protein Terrestrivirus1_186 [Terrestrivirus sp.]|uniref:Uncharacterized protein n=1 Tax=Terrestrivirus sp. TaxID=2487775 RepID=A0A3G4ZKF0_9VIRU|nr:MAG: hypothetical protein Terrestrivirus1_186 [Terrestrivirus sp.]
MQYDIYNISKNTEDISRNVTQITKNLGDIEQKIVAGNDNNGQYLKEILGQQKQTNEYLKQLNDYNKCDSCDNGYKYIVCNKCSGKGYNSINKPCSTCGKFSSTSTYKTGHVDHKPGVRYTITNTNTIDCSCNYDKGWIDSTKKSIASKLKKELYDIKIESNYCDKYKRDFWYRCIIMNPSFDYFGNITSYSRVCLASVDTGFWNTQKLEATNKFDYFMSLFFDCWHFEYSEVCHQITLTNMKTKQTKVVTKNCNHSSQKYSVTEYCGNHKTGDERKYCSCYIPGKHSYGLAPVTCDKCNGTGKKK